MTARQAWWHSEIPAFSNRLCIGVPQPCVWMAQHGQARQQRRQGGGVCEFWVVSISGPSFPRGYAVHLTCAQLVAGLLCAGRAAHTCRCLRAAAAGGRRGWRAAAHAPPGGRGGEPDIHELPGRLLQRRVWWRRRWLWRHRWRQRGSHPACEFHQPPALSFL